MRLIDADRLSKVIYGNVPAPYEDSREAKEECLREIEDAPTVDAVPVVYGRWVFGGDGCVICSKCNEEESNNNHRNFCPNCGARLQVGGTNGKEGTSE